jgi:hypothetical protein
MKKLALSALVLLAAAHTAVAGDISIGLSSNDSRVELASRRNPRNAQLAITSRDGSTVLMLTKDVVAMQLSDAALAKLEAEEKKEDLNFLEELILAGVQLAVGKSMEYPLANMKADYRNGALFFANEKNEPIFTEVKVNGVEILKNFSAADASRFVAAVRAAQSRSRN